MQETPDVTAVIGKSSHRKMKSSSTREEHEAFRKKNLTKKISLAATILQANNLLSKTKPTDIVAMYKSLKEGLDQCFQCGQDLLPSKIPAENIHLALDSLKYYVYVEKQKEQVQLE